MTDFYFNSKFFNDCLEQLNMKPTTFAKRAGLDKSTVCQLSKGKYHVQEKTRVLHDLENTLQQMNIKNTEQLFQKPGKKLIPRSENRNSTVINFFNLTDEPFQNGVTHKVWFNGEYEAVYKTVLSTVENRELRAVIGAFGSGKSTLFRMCLREFKEQSRFRVTDIPAIHAKHLNDRYLVETIIEELGGLKVPQGFRRKAKTMNHVISEMNNREIKLAIFIDEAQNLSDEVLKEIRLLWENWLAQEASISFILFGKPELRLKLEKRSMMEVSKRLKVTELPGFSSPQGKADIADYIDFRLSIVGGTGDIFSDDAVEFIRGKANTPIDVHIFAQAGMAAAANIHEKPVTAEHIVAGLTTL